jgi:adenine-specific DNA-methyltransferase
MATRKPAAPAAGKKPKAAPAATQTGSYKHTEPKALLRPEIGVQNYAASQGKFKRGPTKYRYDDSLAPELAWDSQNPSRERGEALIARVAELAAQLQKLPPAQTAESAKQYQELLAELTQATKELKALSKPFLNWSGKAERVSFDVPTLPLFIHERLSTEAILETLKSHRASTQTDWLNDLFGNPERPVWEQLTQSYSHANGWNNRMILGDSLVVMNSLAQFERMAGQVQMIYMDPPYGVKFGSNFQPFVRRRDVSADDADMTREPEMVKAYRDTWELGLHSYLTYLRDRLLVARELLADSGSIFVQISDDNLHHVREVMDEVFGAENFCSLIIVEKTSSASSKQLDSIADYLLWYGKDIERTKYRQVYRQKLLGAEGTTQYVWALAPDGLRERRLTTEELAAPDTIPKGWRIFACDNLTSQRPARGTDVREFTYENTSFTPGKGTFKTQLSGLQALASAGRLKPIGKSLMYRRFLEDFPVSPVANVWKDAKQTGFTEEKLYSVQTAKAVIERCILMTTDPGDLVLDPTCGSGTTAYVAELWGRRWITMDTSRVPLALARQRLLTATFPFYELKDPARGPAGGFKYVRKQNNKGEEVGGIVPHVTLKSIANNEPPDYEVLVDRPEVQKGITRVTGRFVVEATIPTPQGLDNASDTVRPEQSEGSESASRSSNPSTGSGRTDNGDDWTARMIGILRASPLLHVGGGRTLKLASIREPAQALTLSAEAMALAETLNDELTATGIANGELPLVGGDAGGKPVAILFGPENGALTESTVRSAHDEASMKSRGYAHLYVIGFAIEPRAREYLEHAAKLGVPATYVQATPDVLMGDLLKNMRSSQIFSVCGLPDVTVERVPAPDDAAPAAKDWPYFQVTLNGLDVFDPASQEVDHRTGNDVPAWLLDTDYNDMVFHVNQAFFPRTSAWDNLKRSLKADFDESVWAHLSGDTSAPFTLGRHGKIAVKVIDDRGNELMVIRELKGLAGGKP